MIKDYPLFGIGAGGWQANYMLYQAEYFLQNPNSPYILLADNIFYAYNEFLHITAEQGIVGLVVVTWLLYALFSYKEKNNTDQLPEIRLNHFLSLLFFFLSWRGFSTRNIIHQHNRYDEKQNHKNVYNIKFYKIYH